MANYNFARLDRHSKGVGGGRQTKHAWAEAVIAEASTGLRRGAERQQNQNQGRGHPGSGGEEEEKPTRPSLTASAAPAAQSAPIHRTTSAAGQTSDWKLGKAKQCDCIS